MTIVLGVTGSIGMGKTEAARALARWGHPVFSADAEVHRLLAEDTHTIRTVGRAFPMAKAGGAIDRTVLGAEVFGSETALRRLERILHPRIRTAEQTFVREARRRRARLAVLEIPLLFETGAERLCDVVVVVSAPAAVQRARVLRRPGMTLARLRAIKKRQLSNLEKRRRADYVVETGVPKPKMLRQLRKIVTSLVSD